MGCSGLRLPTWAAAAPPSPSDWDGRRPAEGAGRPQPLQRPVVHARALGGGGAVPPRGGRVTPGRDRGARLAVGLPRHRRGREGLR